MKPIGTLATTIVRKAAAEQRTRLIAAHSAAEDYHCNMVRALQCQEDLEDDDIGPAERRELERRHAEAVGLAAMAYGKMPYLWAAVTEQAL